MHLSSTLSNDTFFSTCAVEKDDLYFFNDGNCIPIKYNLINGNKKTMLSDECYGELNGANADGTFIYKDKLIGVRNRGDKIVVVNMNASGFEFITINGNYKACDNFSLITMKEEKLYIFCRAVPKVIIFDCETLCVEEIAIESDDRLGYHVAAVKGNFVILVKKDCQQFVIYNTKSHKCETRGLQRQFENIKAIQVYDNILYVIDSKGWAYCVDMIDGSILNEIKIGADNEYGLICTNGKSVIILPLLGENILVADKLLKVISIYSNYPKDFYYDDKVGVNKSKYFFPYSDEKFYYYGQRKANYILRIKKDTLDLDWIKLPDIIRWLNKNKYFRENKKLYENEWFDLKEYVDRV